MHIDETQPLANVVANDDSIGVQRSPVIGARCVKELELELFCPCLDAKYVRLVDITKHRNWIDMFAGTESAEEMVFSIRYPEIQ